MKLAADAAVEVEGGGQGRWRSRKVEVTEGGGHGSWKVDSGMNPHVT